jgi:predicted metal-dependent phosphoesterase TrpH
MMRVEPTRVLRADLHVHSIHSGFTKTLRMFRSRDCYSDPVAIYRRARQRGLDVVTITDHNSLDGCLELRDRFPDAPDILMGEEIDCRVPDSGILVHLGAFGLSERHHREVQPLRDNVFEAAAFLRAEGVALVLHHPFHFFRGEVDVVHYLGALLPLVHAVETRNATMAGAHNSLAAEVVQAWNTGGCVRPLGHTGGSDAHVLGHVGSAYTEAPGLTAADFLDSLKRGNCRAAGAHGSIGSLAYEIYGVVFNYWGALLGLRPSGLTPAERAGAIGSSLLSLPFQFIPILVTLEQKRAELRRVAGWQRQLQGTLGRPGPAVWCNEG